MYPPVPAYAAGALDLSGRYGRPMYEVGATPDQMQAALAQVMNTPAFQQCLCDQMQGGGGNPAASYGGPGVAYGSRPTLSDRMPTKFRESVLGFALGGIAGGTAVNVTSQPQVSAFRGERLVVPSAVNTNFDILNVLVGVETAFVSSTAVPAQVFDQGGVGVRLSMATATPGMTIALSVANTTNSTQTFKAAIIGTAASY